MKRKKNLANKISRKVTGITALISFMLLLGYTGSCELDRITSGQYAVRAIICLIVFGVSAFVNDKLHGGVYYE